MGARAGAIAYILCGGKESKVVIEFALWVAEYVLQQQVYLWGHNMEHEDKVRTTAPANLFKMLPDEFTRKEMEDLRAVDGQGTNVRQIISRWKKAGMIQELEKNRYQKI